jgi:hypothetical protein
MASPNMGLGSGSGLRRTASRSCESWRSPPKLLDFDVLLALELEEVPDAKRLLGIVEVEVLFVPNRALVHAKDAELSHERIVDDLDDVGHDPPVRVGLGEIVALLGVFGILAGELGDLDFGRGGAEAGHDVDEV